MRRANSPYWTLRVALLGTLTITTLGGGACEEHQVCDQAGCAYPARIVLEVPAQDEPLALELCRNDECGTILWTVENGRAVASPAEVLTQPEVDCFVNVSKDPWWFFMGFGLSLSPAERIDGDYYRVTLSVNRTGEVLANFEDHVTYVSFYPNGPDCDKEICRVANGGPFGYAGGNSD